MKGNSQSGIVVTVRGARIFGQPRFCAEHGCESGPERHDRPQDGDRHGADVEAVLVAKCCQCQDIV